MDEARHPSIQYGHTVYKIHLQSDVVVNWLQCFTPGPADYSQTAQLACVAANGPIKDIISLSQRLSD